MSTFEQYFYQQIGLKIRKYRQLRGLTQEQLSELLGLNYKYIGHVERCERNISNKVLIQLLELFRITPQEFFDFDKLYIWDK